VPLGQHGVNEGAAEVEAPPGALEHPLDQLVDLRLGEHQIGQLVPPVASHEHPARVVDPDLLDGRVVEVGLERAEPGHPRDQLAHQRLDVGDRRDDPGEAARVVVKDHALDDAPDHRHVLLRVHALAADQRPDVLVELLHDGLGQPTVQSIGLRDRHRVPDPESAESPRRRTRAWDVKPGQPRQGRTSGRSVDEGGAGESPEQAVSGDA